ncbi:MAG: DUF3418 domain-containing protein, partial [Candidatus Nanopelagicales bacterium]
PGHRAELITALLRSPGKDIRRQLGPAPNLVPALLDSPELIGTPILAAVAAAAARITGVRLSAQDWDLGRVPLHLLPRYRVLDEAGTVLGEGRDLADLQRRHAPDRARMLARAADDLSVTGARAWVFGVIPATVQRIVSGVPVTGYPALADRGSTVDLLVMADPGLAQRTHRRGVRRLIVLRVPDPAPRGHSGVDLTSRLVLGRYPHGGASNLLADVADACVDALLTGSEIRSQDAFEAAAARITLELPRRYAAALTQVVAALTDAWDAERTIDGLRSPVVADSVADIRAELDRLVGPAPISRIGAERLPDLRRHLQALAWRASKLADDPSGDARRRAEVHRAQDLLATRVVGWPVPDPMLADPLAATARQLADEFRVSLFAPHIRTAVPVSARRIEKFVAGLGG